MMFRKFLQLSILSALILSISACGGVEKEKVRKENTLTPQTIRDSRQNMRDFIQDISAYAKGIKYNFIVIPQNGHDLLTENGEETGTSAMLYMDAIDGVGREDIFYGYDDDDITTPVSERDLMISFMDIAESNDVEVLTTDYCSNVSFIDDSYSQNAARGYISFAADHRELDNIPVYPQKPFNMNFTDVTSLFEAKNFLYLLNSSSYPNKENFLNAIKNTHYDVLIIDAFYDSDILRSDDVATLQTKPNGVSRLVIAYMSIGEAEDYRYYWQNSWTSNPPSWLEKENPNWYGNYKVRYWDSAWQDIIYGNDTSYLRKILDAGFDGVYLDIIDAFEYFES
ncbi:endo alpha-1,4 polygalactosaminidase [Chloroflexota bacterium]